MKQRNGNVLEFLNLSLVNHGVNFVCINYILGWHISWEIEWVIGKGKPFVQALEFFHSNFNEFSEPHPTEFQFEKHIKEGR